VSIQILGYCGKRNIVYDGVTESFLQFVQKAAIVLPFALSPGLNPVVFLKKHVD
jgi:hypothetical protein